MEQCEKKIYMSPFELQFCLYFRKFYRQLVIPNEILRLGSRKQRTKQRLERLLPMENFHQNIFCYDERGYGYFMNFENAKTGSPYHDLSPIFT